MSSENWPLKNSEYEYIKIVVADIFVRYDVKCIPVSGFEIASKMGITMIPYSSFSPKKLAVALKTSDDGFYCENNCQECIFYNDIDRSYERQNMTLLHEIGHCVLDHTGLKENALHEEAEAKFFAKYAIAPPVLIHKIGATCWEEVYDNFDISAEAAMYAYSYYHTWLRRKSRLGRLEQYEAKILKQYSKSA